MISPLDDNVCVSEEEYFAYFEHELGSDCKAGTADDGPRSEFYCPPKFTFNYDFCACVLDECFYICPIETNPNPFECGSCITDKELAELKDNGLDE